MEFLVLLNISKLIDSDTVKRLRVWLVEATFRDGRSTAGSEARKVKHNEQVDNADPNLAEMQRLVTARLREHRLFMMAARPKTIQPPLFSRYTQGMTYGSHVDNALMSGLRTDVSLTVFLSDPDSYEGGELIIESSAGEQGIKLDAGSAVLYPTTALHRVAPVQSGQRFAAVTWVRSLVRDPAAREILFDLETARHCLSKKLEKGTELDLLAKTQSNLMRRWIED